VCVVGVLDLVEARNNFPYLSELRVYLDEKVIITDRRDSCHIVITA